MAYEASQPLKLSLEAGADLSALQYYFVKLNSSGKAVAVAAVTDVPIGVRGLYPARNRSLQVLNRWHCALPKPSLSTRWCVYKHFLSGNL